MADPLRKVRPENFCLKQLRVASGRLTRASCESWTSARRQTSVRASSTPTLVHVKDSSTHLCCACSGRHRPNRRQPHEAVVGPHPTGSFLDTLYEILTNPEHKTITAQRQMFFRVSATALSTEHSHRLSALYDDFMTRVDELYDELVAADYSDPN